MKRFIGIILFLCIICSATSVSAEGVNDEVEVLTYTRSNFVATYDIESKVLEIKGNGALYDDVHFFDDVSFIRDTLPFLGYPDEKVDFNTSSKILSVEKIKIHKGITSIGNQNFLRLQNLKEVELPTSLATIGERAFYGCTNLSDISVNNVKTICSGAFMNCKSLRYVRFPALETLEETPTDNCYCCEDWSYDLQCSYYGAFQNCENLQEIYLPKVEYIGERSFYGCSSLKSLFQNYAIECDRPYNDLRNVKYVGASAFYNCKSLKEIYLDKVENLYSDKSRLDARVYTQYDFISEKTILAPRAYEGTFDGCTSLKKCYIPNARRIDERTFYNCQSLTYLAKSNTLKKVYEVGAAAFGNCKSLKNIKLNKVDTLETAKWYKYDDSKFTFDFDVCSYGDPYRGKNGERVIPGELKCGTFQGCSKLESVELSGLKSFSLQTFKGCKKLKSIKLGSSVRTIPEKAFHNCSSLKSFTIPKNVKTIKKHSFYNCKALKTVTIKSKSICTIGKDAFKNTYTKIKFQCPKSKLAKYKMLLKSNAPKKAKYKTA